MNKIQIKILLKNNRQKIFNKNLKDNKKNNQYAATIQ